MANRAGDWFAQAERDLEQARASQRDGRHEWACFAAQQAAEKAVKAVHYRRGARAVIGHNVRALIEALDPREARLVAGRAAPSARCSSRTPR